MSDNLMRLCICLTAEDKQRIDRLIELLERNAGENRPSATNSTPESEDKPAEVQKPAETEKPENAAPTAPKTAPDRRTVKSIAVKKIQAGHRDEVKALIQKYGAEKIDQVPEDQLVTFLEELEAI